MPRSIRGLSPRAPPPRKIGEACDTGFDIKQTPETRHPPVEWVVREAAEHLPVTVLIVHDQQDGQPPLEHASSRTPGPLPLENGE